MLSLMESAKQHTTVEGYPASNALDGDLSTLSLTADVVGAWLTIKLTPGTTIGSVLVYNRRDAPSLADRLGTFEVWAAHSYGSSSTFCGAGAYDAATDQIAPYRIVCESNRQGTGPGIVGFDYVTIRLTGGVARRLCLAEVSVELPAVPPISPPGPPTSPAPPTPPTPLAPPPPLPILPVPLIPPPPPDLPPPSPSPPPPPIRPPRPPPGCCAPDDNLMLPTLYIFGGLLLCCLQCFVLVRCVLLPKLRRVNRKQELRFSTVSATFAHVPPPPRVLAIPSVSTTRPAPDGCSPPASASASARASGHASGVSLMSKTPAPPAADPFAAELSSCKLGQERANHGHATNTSVARNGPQPGHASSSSAYRADPMAPSREHPGRMPPVAAEHDPESLSPNTQSRRRAAEERRRQRLQRSSSVACAPVVDAGAPLASRMLALPSIPAEHRAAPGCAPPLARHAQPPPADAGSAAASTGQVVPDRHAGGVKTKRVSTTPDENASDNAGTLLCSSTPNENKERSAAALTTATTAATATPPPAPPLPASESAAAAGTTLLVKRATTSPSSPASQADMPSPRRLVMNPKKKLPPLRPAGRPPERS